MAKPGRKQKTAGETCIESRWVPDPSVTDAQFYHLKEQFPNSVRIGKMKADVKMTTLIGGFARIRGRTEAQTQAAARFRGLWERAQLGGAKAIDYGAVRVDSSGQGEDAIFEMGERARREYSSAVQRLGMIQSSLAEKVIVHDMSVHQVAKSLGVGAGGAARERVTVEVREAVEALADHFGYLGTPPTRSDQTAWDDGTEQSYTGPVSTRKVGANKAA